jgi:hypothetical protein
MLTDRCLYFVAVPHYQRVVGRLIVMKERTHDHIHACCSRFGDGNYEVEVRRASPNTT